MKYLVLFLALVLICCQAPTKDEYSLVWSDEFDYTGMPDSSKWTFQLGDGCPDLCGWGNNELETYTKELKNVRVESGNLVIEAHREGDGYTSTRLTTIDKGAWESGRIHVRATLPTARGTWPAIWMLPDVERLSWPEDGEIDIMEHVGFNEGTIFGTIHTEKYNHVIGTQKIDSISISDVSQFHDYILEWEKDQLTWIVDDDAYHVLKRNGEDKGGWPFDQPFYLILNLAVGGNWGGQYGVDSAAFPQKMEIDFVRIYQKG